MYLPSNCPDISNELYIQRYGNGVKLVRPDAKISALQNETHTLAHASRLAFSFCLLNTESEILRMNEAGAELNGFASENDIVGKSLFDLYERDNAQVLRNDDIAILRSKKTCIDENKPARKDGVTFHNLTIDAPWYDDDDRLVGLLGFSVVLGGLPAAPIEPALNYLRELGLLAPLTSTTINNISLTSREKSCLDQLMRGKSFKQIGESLHISARTVEHCIERIKVKFGVKTKFQLIEALQSYYL